MRERKQVGLRGGKVNAELCRFARAGALPFEQRAFLFFAGLTSGSESCDVALAGASSALYCLIRSPSPRCPNSGVTVAPAVVRARR